MNRKAGGLSAGTRVAPSGRRDAAGVWLARHGVRWCVALAGVAGAALCWTGIIGDGLEPAAQASLAVASLAVGLWGSELLALPVTALLAMVLLFVLGAASRVEQAFAGFGSPVLFFLLGSAALGVAAEHSGLADRLAGWLLRRSRGSGRRLLAELMLTLPLQALVVPSAISRNAVLVPVYQRVLIRLGRPRRLGAAVMLTLGVLGPLASSALLSGGTSPVAAAQAIGGFTWFSWLIALALPYYVLITLDGAVLWLLTRPAKRLHLSDPTGSDPGPGREPETSAFEPKRGGGRTVAGEWRVAAISTMTALLWMLDGLTGWPPAIPALLALVLLLTPRLGVMSWQTFARSAPWGTCVVLAAAVSLAAALAQTGAAAWMADGLFGRFAAPRSAAGVALAVAGVTALITLAIPNRAAAITLGIPLAAAYAADGPLSAAAAGLVVMIVVDAETIYPAQTAANLLAYDTGYFSAGALARYNLITLALAALVIVAVALPWWSLVGLPT
jgi:sodium-dependent dicarboxylate transporter 2/3/5